ncbi:MAG: hypothetical protein AAF988_04725 [Pseudomonadota bacterium]
MLLSAKQAAKATGKSVPTITRAIKSGKISAAKNTNGGYEIDPSELFRVFPALKGGRGNEAGNVTPDMLPFESPNVTSALEVEIKFLREKVADREQQLSEKNDLIESLSNKLDKAQSTLDHQTLLLTHHAKQNSAVDGLVWLPPILGLSILAVTCYVLFIVP